MAVQRRSCRFAQLVVGIGTPRRRCLWPLRPPSGRFRPSGAGMSARMYRTTAPLETAFDTALAGSRHSPPPCPPARRTLRLSGPARKARSAMAKMSPGGRGSLASVHDAQAVRALCDAQAAAGELADGDGESGGGEA